tara:strand:+ start:1695 stop:2783 length:1089 start_codon:yes stop_codon:yes gene_type:complete
MESEESAEAFRQSIDMSLQITIPNEWEKMAPVNIGYTAGIETTKVTPNWIEKANMMDRIVVVSNHSKNSFEETEYTATNNMTQEQVELKCTVPITAVNYPVKKFDSVDLNLDFDYDFNYLAVAQWGPRKNLDNTIRWFVEENFDQEVGLVIKTFIRRGNVIDRFYTEGRVQNFLSQYKDRKCKIYLLHGDLTDQEMHSLYQHEKIKALISLTHGEGFGLPLFEAAYNGLPVIAPGWSGQADFLYAPFKSKNRKTKSKLKAYFAEVNYTMQPIPEFAKWPGVIAEDSMWCEPEQGSYKMRLRQMRKNYDKWQKKALYLQKWIHENFTEEKQYKAFADAVLPAREEELVDVSQWLDSMKVREFE